MAHVEDTESQGGEAVTFIPGVSPTDPAGLNTRVARLEQTLTGVQTSVAGMDAKLDAALSNTRAKQGHVPTAAVLQFLGLLAVWSGVAGTLVYTYVEGQTASLHTSMQNVASNIETHQDGHPHTVLGEIGKLQAQFAEVETQSRALKELMLLRDELTVYRARYGGTDAPAALYASPQWSRRDDSRPSVSSQPPTQVHSHPHTSEVKP